jgi:cobalt-zinc-cadmium efflux system outer membrane protein
LKAIFVHIGFAVFGIAPAGLLLIGGCAARPSSAGLEAALVKAGVAEAIVFKIHGGPVDVATESSSSVLTLPDAVQRTLRTDPDVQAASARVRAAEAETDQVRLLPNPIVSVVSRFPENSGKPVIEADLGFELLSLLQRPGRISVADHRLRGASAEVIAAVLDSIAEVEERYAAVQSLDAQMPVLQEQRALLDRLFKLAQDRLNKGEGTRLDVTTLETQQWALEVEISQKRLARRQERLALARLLGEPSGPAAWTLSPWSTPTQVGSEAAWMTAALLRRPEVESQRWELAALGVETRLARFSPFEPAEIGVKAERDVGEPWTIGPALSAPIPLFDWGQAKRAKANALQSEAEHKLTKIQRTVVEEVRKAHAAYVESIGALALARDRLVPAQERRRQETEDAYKAGLTDVASLVLADQDLLASKAKLIELEEQASSALVKLERAVGGPGVAAGLRDAGPVTRPAAPGTSPSEQPKED